jgi:hypothetical protein
MGEIEEPAATNIADQAADPFTGGANRIGR